MLDQTFQALVQARVQSGREPYDILYQRARARAATAPLPELSEKNFRTAIDNGNIAKSAAFLYWLNREAEMGEKAARLLNEMKTEPPAFYLLKMATGANDILHMSESLTSRAQAYHFLACADHPNLQLARSNLTALAKNVSELAGAILKYGGAVSNIFGIVTRHNYLLKSSSAIGLAGLYLERPDLVALGQKGVAAVAAVQGPTLERGWGEGSNYFAYSAVNFLPFFIALNRYRSMHGENFHGARLENYLADPVWRTVFLWYLKTRLPSGERPGVDDARYLPFYSGLLATAPELPEHKTDHFEVSPSFWAWDWFSPELSVIGADARFHTAGTVDLTADMLINFDDRTPRLEPGGPGFEPSQISHVCGQAVLRSAWDRDALYFLLQGENRKMVEAGSEHEHNDGTSFILCAYGELLAIDPGYPGWKRHKQTNQPEHHNRILIEDHKPEKEARLANFFVMDELEGVQSSTVFEKKNGKRPAHERNAIMVGKRLLVLDDVVENAGGKNIVSRLHGYAGGSLGPEASFQAHEWGGSWRRAKASLHAYQTTSSGLPRFEQQLGFHGLQFVNEAGSTPEHQILVATQSGEALRFLTILYPQRTGRSAPLVTLLAPSSGSAFLLEEKESDRASIKTLMATQEKSGMAQISAPDFGEIVYEGKFMLLALEAQPLPHIFYGDHVTEIKWQSRSYLKAQLPFHGALVWDYRNAILRGRQISATTTNQLNIYTGQMPLQVSGLEKTRFDEASGVLAVEIAPTTNEFEIKLKPPPSDA